MLAGIRKQKRPMCRGLIILLLSSWVSYVCQPCFAGGGSHGQQASINTMPCHPVSHTPDRHIPGDTGKSTAPDCDCHLFIALTVQYQDAWSTAGSTSGFDLPLYASHGIDMETWSLFTDADYRYPEPERALSPPFDRYTVLLN